MAKSVKNKTADTENEALFTRDSLLSARRFRDKKDLLSAVLKENQSYTASQAEEIIEKYLKGRVK